MGNIPFRHLVDGEEVSPNQFRPSFQLYYCNFEHISSQLTLPFLLALSEIHLTYLVPIKTGNGDGGAAIATVSRGGGGEQCRISAVISIILLQFLAHCITTNLSISPCPF